MVRRLSLALSKAGVPGLRRSRRRRRADRGGDPRRSTENKSWLLADPATAEVDLHSVHSSFRFSFGSQDEAGELPSAPPEVIVLLLVDLEDEGEEDGKGDGGVAEAAAAQSQQFWQRLRSLESSISPVAGSLIRFSDPASLAAGGIGIIGAGGRLTTLQKIEIEGRRV